MPPQISYGKAAISVYRTHARPLQGVVPIPESSFTGRSNTLFAAEIEVEVFGTEFLAAYTVGDNSRVVATDTMKNFVLLYSRSWGGSTLEEFVYGLAQAFLATYSGMERLRITATETPFAAAQVPQSGGFGASDVLLSRRHDDHAVVVLEVERGHDGLRVVDLACCQAGLQLIKLTGSSFARFHRDDYTTLPEVIDRPLFVYLDVGWHYREPEATLAGDSRHYVAPEQVRDCVMVVFHRFVSKSIQHLVYEMGMRLLDRFPQLAEVSFDAQNRLWDTANVDQSDERVKVYTDPRPPYGLIRLRMPRESAAVD
ncbi:MAG: hypothetical protein NVSMB42_04420 [Herpetosiphon sp.]